MHVTSKYKLEATGVDGRSFEALLKFPGQHCFTMLCSINSYRLSHLVLFLTYFILVVCVGTRLRKSSKNFVQWKDDDNGIVIRAINAMFFISTLLGNAWGLNFMNESDTDSFLKSCSVR